MTAYGGSTFSHTLVEKAAGKRYGLTEFHPLQDKDASINETALQYHRANGAVFITPYFMSIVNERGNDNHNRMLISPKNRQRGSNNLYKAIKRMAQQ